MNGLVVIFPGIGYNSSRPLLYYSKKMVKKHGFDTVIEVEYKDLVFDKGNLIKDKEAQKEIFKKCLSCAKDCLSNVNWKEYDSVLFISKSIGTIAACAMENELKDVKIKQILLTPLEETFQFPVKNAVGFIGNVDPWSRYEKVMELALENRIPMHTYEGANHSIETGDVLIDIDYLKNVMEIADSFISSK